MVELRSGVQLADFLSRAPNIGSRPIVGRIHYGVRIVRA
jgi:hypothetical protein